MGDPTEVALVEYFKEGAPVEELQQQYPRVAELPFDSERKCMTTVHEYEDCFIAITKGAVEAVTSMLQEGRKKEDIQEDAKNMAKQGLRVLAFGYRLLDQLPADVTVETIEQDIKFAGLVGMIDPPRPEVVNAITECKTAGIQPVMITGDHPQTAATIAREIGILTDDGLVVTGSELGHFSAEELEQKVERIRW